MGFPAASLICIPPVEPEFGDTPETMPCTVTLLLKFPVVALTEPPDTFVAVVAFVALVAFVAFVAVAALPPIFKLAAVPESPVPGPLN